jgi:hypothetical protein
MNIELIPTLAIQRELYEKPRDMVRFQWYLDQVIGETEPGKRDVVVPIGAANPMGREHCLATAQALLAIDAEAVMMQAIEEARTRLADVNCEARVALNILDDLRGGWTHRYFNEAGMRFGSEYSQRANRSRQFVIVPCWASEAHTPASVRSETLAALFRHAWWQKHGVTKTLKEIMPLDGYASRFASPSPVLSHSDGPGEGSDGLSHRRGEGLDADDLAYTREVLQPHLDAHELPITLPCMFGDPAARECGYEPMGLSARAGFALALDEARNSPVTAEEMLSQP